jgi:hypothetical protein
VTIQQGGQTVYPTHVQYVDGSDPGIYANGQMYEISIIRCASVCCGLHTGLSGSNAWLLCTNILNIVIGLAMFFSCKKGVEILLKQLLHRIRFLVMGDCEVSSSRSKDIALHAP